MPVKIFFCYAHKDETLLKELKTHLSLLLREGLIDVWYDREISAGTKWEQQIDEQLNSAQIILLLISPDFMASDYINNVELKKALERDKRGEARVIPVILRHASWKISTLRNLQALPTDGKPIKSWSDQDEAFFNVAEGIRKVVLQLTAPPAVISPVPEEKEQELTIASVLTPSVERGGSMSRFLPPFAFEKLTLLHTLGGHNDPVWCVALSADAKTLVSGSTDRTIKVWNLSTGQVLRTLTGHFKSVESVVLSADAKTLISGSTDSNIKVWRA
jgi:WD40 repeat protein